jgi:SAM-dependent methyltransferase
MPLYLDDHHTDEVKKRHVDRYTTAIALVSLSGGKWLDAACGSGYGTWLMAEYADIAVGVDTDPDAIKYAREHYQPPVDEFLHRDLLLPNLDPLWGNFDVIVSVETIEHLNPNGQAALIRQFSQWLGPSGVLSLTCPIRDGGGPNPNNPAHIWEPDRDELLNLLSVYFTHATTLINQVKMTSGEVQPNLYVRCKR